MKLNKDYYLLLADLKDSTTLPEDIRDRGFKKLEQEIGKINREYGKEMALPLTLSYGDEIAGLFEVPGAIYDIVDRLREALHPEGGLTGRSACQEE